MVLSRRGLIAWLSSAAPLSFMLSEQVVAADSDDLILKVSRIIVGRVDLDPGIAKRIGEILSGRVKVFGERLSSLAAALGDGKDRDGALSGLAGDNLDLALIIAQPWYTGHVGTPSEHYQDDAVFVTYLGAEAHRLVADVLPWPSYSTGAPGWWADAPAGVSAPPMPREIVDWTFVPQNLSSSVATAEPRFLALVDSAGATWK